MSNFTNSPLVSYTRISPNRNSPRTEDKITKIIIHHMAGVASVESFGELVANPQREMSANYAIGNDGRIGLYCEEKDRCWCSSSRWADNRGIAIEVSNSKLGEPWPISKKAWDSMINLCADICKRNGIPKMTYTGDKDGVLCFHRWFAATGCVPIDTTEVLTPTGWVPIRDIKVGDVIATVNPRDFSIKFDTVENMTPVHKDTVFKLNGMDITREHRVLYTSNDISGYKLDDYQKICDQAFTVPTAGTYETSGMDITSSEMVFLLEIQRVGSYDEKNKYIEFHYISEQKVGYMDGLLKNLGYKYAREQEDLGPVKFTITDPRAWSLCKTYLSGIDFNWKWLKMNPTQFSYFIYKATSHVDTGWTRRYVSESIVNIDIVQALCALNERGSHYIPEENALYVNDAYRMIHTHNVKTQEDVDVACVTVKSGCFLMRQYGTTTLTGNCPGEYIYSRAQQICDEVNAKLADMKDDVKPEPVVEPQKPVGDVKPSPTTAIVPYLKRIEQGTRVYNIDTLTSGRVVPMTSVYTIVEERIVNGTKYGKMKSGIGWIIVETNVATSNQFFPGDTVAPIQPITYDGKAFIIYEKSYKVLRVNGDRVVISSDGVNVTAAVRASNLMKL